MRNLLVFILVFAATVIQGQELTRKQYIEKYKDIAISNMRNYKIPASITLAQGCLESRNGNSELSAKSNNHFGIKCHSSWKGKRTYYDDDKKGECFRVYKNPEESFADHSQFLQKSRYAKCFELDIMDYKGWARELKRAGYATNPKYPDLLIKIIEYNDLTKYDKIAMGKGIKEEPVAKKENTTEDVDSEGEDFVIDMYNSLVVKKSENQIKYVEAEGGQTPEEIAVMFDMGIWQIRNYNDLDKNVRFEGGETVYLQPKRRKGAQEFYTVESDSETIASVSQKFGIKEFSLRWKNRLDKGAELKKGMTLYLRKRRPKEE
jgi:hypothetical protein